MPRAARPPRSGRAGAPHTALPGAAALSRPRRRDSGSRGRRRGRSRAARRVRRSPRPPAGDRRSERPSPRGRPAHASRWGGAPARWHRASGGGGPRRTRPGGGRARRCARGRRRSRRSAVPGVRRARRARRCERGRRRGTVAGARRAATACRTPRAACAFPPRRARRAAHSPSGRPVPPRARTPPPASPRAPSGPAGARASAAWAIVSRRQRLRQPCSLATSSVRWRPSSRLTSAPWIGRSPTARAACGELHRAVDGVVIGQRERVVAELERRRGQLLGQRDAVQEGVGGVAVELDVGACGAHRWRNQPPPARSWKTTRSRPPTLTSSQ